MQFVSVLNTNIYRILSSYIISICICTMYVCAYMNGSVSDYCATELMMLCIYYG